jgi:hypothetical protein
LYHSSADPRLGLVAVEQVAVELELAAAQYAPKPTMRLAADELVAVEQVAAELVE